ncbi:RNI-like protein [Trametes versicolor FP-101664 SS1]|uniref:RNI-like protein n=1 Tax=Trametes versicolor (strain FP-101664) TaxID=717944 RepID=UPI0004623651|nr:RNI-like protein [Trametes versicolor FP-101664 SS1]EIW61436.1 RNI-like protein [Trametes versicolor FP-101664 SS1]
MMRILSREDQTFVYAQFIRRLNFLNVAHDLTDSLFSRLAQCVRLERLTLMNCTALSDEGLMRVLPQCPNLVALDLTGVAEVTDSTVVAVARSAKRLQGINLTGCKKLTDASIVALAQNCPLLRRVKLSNVEQITDQSLSALARSCPLLLEIDLNNCKRISDSGLRDLWTYSVQMREMRLSHCAELTDAGFPAPPKRDIIPPGMNPFPSAGYAGHASDFPPLKVPQPFDQLRMLDLTGCSLITDDAIEGIVSAAPRIRNLVLAKCTQLTDSAVESICRLGKGLHYLHLGHAGSITDRSINSLVRSCTRLRYIDLANCLQLTDMSVFELSSLPKLRRIGLVRVNNLTDQAIQALGERHATLERIHLSYCDQISVMAIHFLLQKLPKLTHLSLTGIPAFRRAELQQFCRAPPQEFNSQQRAAFCVYSGHGVAKLRDFLADLFATITNELATSNDTDYEDDFDDAEQVEPRTAPDGEGDALEEDDDEEDDTASEVFVAQGSSNVHETPRAPDRPMHEEPPANRTQYTPSREHHIVREPRRHPTPRAHPRAQVASPPTWLDAAGPSRPRRGFGQQPLVEQSTSPTPSEAASNRSAGTNHSTGTAFFRTYTDANPAIRNGVMTPDLVFAEIGHGRGAGPGPSTILAQSPGRREPGPTMENSYPAVSSSPTGRNLTAASATLSMAVFDSRHPPHHRSEPRVDLTSGRPPVLHDASNSYMRPHQHPDGTIGFSVLRETSPRSLSPTPSTRELQESVHSALAGTNPIPEGDGRGRSVKRTLRNTFAVAETFFSSRGAGGSGADGAAGLTGSRDVDTHGH